MGIRLIKRLLNSSNGEIGEFGEISMLFGEMVL